MGAVIAFHCMPMGLLLRTRGPARTHASPCHCACPALSMMPGTQYARGLWQEDRESGREDSELSGRSSSLRPLQETSLPAVVQTKGTSFGGAPLGGRCPADPNNVPCTPPHRLGWDGPREPPVPTAGPRMRLIEAASLGNSAAAMLPVAARLLQLRPEDGGEL